MDLVIMSLCGGGGGKTNERHHLVNQWIINFSVKIICIMIAGVNHTYAYNHFLRKFPQLHTVHGQIN